MLRAALAALLLLASPALAHDGEGQVQIHGAYAIATTPQAKTGTAYMMIHNHASTPDRLLSASSPVAERVELHTSAEVDGVMRMEALPDGLEIPRGGAVVLQRGGIHLMFLGLTDSWEDGEMIPVTLTFEEAGAVTVEVPVDLSRLTDDAGGMGDMDMDHVSMDGMDHDAMDGMDHGGEGN